MRLKILRNSAEEFNKIYSFVSKIHVSRHCVDVNVHPCKENVQFLFEDEILNEIKQAMETELIHGEQAASRLFFTQKPSKVFSSRILCLLMNVALINRSSNSQIFDRSDCRSTKLDGFVSLNKSTSSLPTFPVIKTQFPSVKRKMNQPSPQEPPKPRLETNKIQVDEEDCPTELSSVIELQNEFKNQREKGGVYCNTVDLTEVISSCTFVGTVNEKYSLIQHKESLVMLEMRVLSRNLFYQLILDNFGDFESFNIPVYCGLYTL
ncbi:DNA mismatch repair protein Mlh1-like [Octopus sinensis]|uniref:DNA mismatch repair protein Mlh1-like n=1 Tax=Octopus sinensis TaxID=2607531 RepID=A0A6P7U0M8_9MOLL|nr:DNA mismatch repair protein Mlh1-like [Octopus sinensis]